MYAVEIYTTWSPANDSFQWIVLIGSYPPAGYHMTRVRTINRYFGISKIFYKNGLLYTDSLHDFVHNIDSLEYLCECVTNHSQMTDSHR